MINQIKGWIDTFFWFIGGLAIVLAGFCVLSQEKGEMGNLSVVLTVVGGLALIVLPAAYMSIGACHYFLLRKSRRNGYRREPALVLPKPGGWFGWIFNKSGWHQVNRL